MLVAHQAGRFGERPAAVRIERDARFGKALVQGGDRGHFLVAGEHAALQLEVGEAVARVRRFGQADDGAGIERRLVAQRGPGVALGIAAIGQLASPPVADVEQVAEHRHALALPAFAEQGRDRHAEMLAEQIEQGALEAGDGVDGGAQVEGLQAAAAGVAIGEAPLHLREQLAQLAERTADQQRLGIGHDLRDRRAARHFADAGVARRVADDDEVAGEERGVRAAQVEQHAVVAGHRNAANRGHARSVRRSHRTTRAGRVLSDRRAGRRAGAARGCSPGACASPRARPRCPCRRWRRGSSRARH